jgi:hypothetical protein
MAFPAALGTHAGTDGSNKLHVQPGPAGVWATQIQREKLGLGYTKSVTVNERAWILVSCDTAPSLGRKTKRNRPKRKEGSDRCSRFRISVWVPFAHTDQIRLPPTPTPWGRSGRRKGIPCGGCLDWVRGGPRIDGLVRRSRARRQQPSPESRPPICPVTTL